ncbi:MAG: hypothetical protein IJ677_07030 [Alphaproteobacteria bacterium]|nr:hypothetical protein [Alphaproteobacteria bacterium]
MKTLAVHLHIHYKEQLNEILSKLANLQGIDYDLFVTVTDNDNQVINKIVAFKSDAKVMCVENRGYDIGPFIEFLHCINLDDYQYVLKVHTKAKHSYNYTHLNNMRFDNTLWGKVLWDALLATPKRVQKDMQILQNPQIGMLSSKYCINKEERNYKKLLGQINKKLVELKLNKTDEPEFVAGSMFYVKSKLLKPLLNMQISDFALTDAEVKEGTLAHVVERILGVIVKEQGYKIYGVNDFYPRFLCWKAALKRFVYQRKVTQNGKLLIKVLKLPVYSKKYKERNKNEIFTVVK